MLMRSSRGTAVTLMLAASLHPSGDARAQDAVAQPVALRFDWPVGTVIHVTTTRFRERVSEDTDTLAGGASYRLMVSEAGEHLRITYDSLRIDLPPGLPAAGALAEATQLTPDFLVSREGEFLELHDAAGYRARLLRALAPMLPDTAAARPFLETLLSEDALTMLAAQEWDALVGAWAGADPDLDTEYQLSAVAPVPLLPGATVPMISLVRVTRAPCGEEPAGDPPACVELRMTSRPDPLGMRIVLEDFVNNLPATGAAGVVFESLDMENEVVVLARPESLLPRRATIEKRITGTVRNGAQRASISQLDRRTYRFEYPPLSR